MEQNSCFKTRRRTIMKEFITKKWKNIALGILGVIFVYLLVRVLTPAPDMSELNKYKLEQINNYYTQKKEEIKNADKKQIDSLLRSRYNF